MALLTIPTVDDGGYVPDVAAFDCEVALEEALKSALSLELDVLNCCEITAAWTRVHALVALCDRP